MHIRSLVAVLFMVGCTKRAEPKLEDVIAKHRAAVEPNIASIERIGKVPLTLAKDGVDLAGCAGCPPPRISTSIDKGGGNALVVYATELADLTRESKDPYRIPDAGLANDCAALIRKRALATPDIPASGFHAQEYLPRCAAAKYAYVIVIKSMTDPVVSASTFSPGAMTGEVHLFLLDGTKHLGGFAFAAETPADVTTVKTSSRSPQGDVNGAFMSQIARAIDAGIKKFVPSAIVD